MFGQKTKRIKELEKKVSELNAINSALEEQLIERVTNIQKQYDLLASKAYIRNGKGQIVKYEKK